MLQTWEFTTTQKIIFGQGSIQKLDELLKETTAKKILIITDKGIRKSGVIDKVKDALNETDYDLFINDDVEQEPTVDFLTKNYKKIKKNFIPDVVLAVGGGSCLDAAKIMSLLITHGGNLLDYATDESSVPGPVIPIIAIPTTAGTGSEVTSVAVVTDEENDLKIGVSDNYLRAEVALLDPELTIGLPSYITACTGIDALAHAIEAYTAKPYKYINQHEKVIFQGSFPLSDTLAYEAIRLIVNNLKTAVYQGENIEARSNMLLGSLLAGMAFSNAGTSLAHALSYPIGALSNSPHGEVTGLLLPYVMQYNTPVNKDKMVKITKAFNQKIENVAESDTANKAPKLVQQLIDDIGLPTKLSAIGIKEENLKEIAEKGLQINRLIRNNPRKGDFEEIMTLLKQAL